jgi:hypothetical protein
LNNYFLQSSIDNTQVFNRTKVLGQIKKLIFFLCVAVIIQNTTLPLSRGLPVRNSPGSKPGITLIVERVHIHGLSRFRNLEKFAHSVKVKVFPANSNVRVPNIEVCFHR